MRFEISPRRILVALLALIVLLNVANATRGLYVFLTRPVEIPWWVKMVHFDHEHNLPNYYQSVVLAISALLLFVAGRRSVPALGRYWTGLALIFSYISIDEFTLIHEQFNPIVREALGTSGFLFFAWVIPYFAATLLVGLVFLKFLVCLPMPTRRIFTLSAVLYVGGALGLELLGGHYFDALGSHSPHYQLVMTLEETLEMLGIAVFIFGLLRHIAADCHRLIIRIGEI